MKKAITIAALACAAVLAMGAMAGCASSSSSGSASASASGSAASTSASAASTSASAASASASAASASASAASASASSASSAAPLADGTYTVKFDTDNSMFHINEALDGKATLTVENGKMTAHIVLASKNIVNLYPGLKENVEKDSASVLNPIPENVTYKDGMTEEVYAFDIPVPVLDEPFDLALVGTKGTWYDHKVTVSDAQPAQ